MLRFTSSPLWVLQSDWREERVKQWNYSLMWKRTKWKRDETWSLTELNESFTPAMMDYVTVLEEKTEISAISQRKVYIFAQIVKHTRKTHNCEIVKGLLLFLWDKEKPADTLQTAGAHKHTHTHTHTQSTHTHTHVDVCVCVCVQMIQLSAVHTL